MAQKSCYRDSSRDTNPKMAQYWEKINGQFGGSSRKLSLSQPFWGPPCTRGLPKCPKMTVTGIGHLHENAYLCQNAPLKWGVLASVTITWPNLCRNAKISHFGIFISIWSRTSRRCQNVPIWKGKYKWYILASVKVFNHVTYLCHSLFGTFWQPWCRMTFRNGIWHWVIYWTFKSVLLAWENIWKETERTRTVNSVWFLSNPESTVSPDTTVLRVLSHQPSSTNLPPLLHSLHK